MVLGWVAESDSLHLPRQLRKIAFLIYLSHRQREHHHQLFLQSFPTVRVHLICRHSIASQLPLWSGGVGGGHEKQVMWDWRLKYFINQCCSRCGVWWLVENSGNPSFQPSTLSQDSPQVLSFSVFSQVLLQIVGRSASIDRFESVSASYAVDGSVFTSLQKRSEILSQRARYWCVWWI